MEKKNMVLLTVIAVATLLVAVVGATFAYFSISTTNNFGGGTSDQGKTNITASDAATADQITIAQESNAGSFTATGVYPGHKEGLEESIKINDFLKNMNHNIYRNTENPKAPYLITIKKF